MKITVLLLVIPFLHATAEGYSQERFSLNLDQVEAAKVFANIQKTSAYRFFYLQNDIKKIGKINIHVTDATIPEIMQKVLGNTLAYKILNNYMVVISPSQADLVSQIDVRGRVTDEAGEPLQGTSVKVKGQSVGVTTEADGSFSIAVDAKAVLEISMVGYETIEIPVNGRNQLDNIVLKIAASGLDEVIVVGYGTQKKASVTGAIATMKADEVKDIPVPNLSSALAGRLSGVYVNQSSGAPGYAPAIRVRSVNTWKSTGNDPLYVIDGIISDKRLFDAMDYNEVENITVLKDAASGAIYGARAANGVILVTTKKGASGKFQLNYSYSYSFDNPSKIPQYVGAKDMVRLNNEARTYRGLPPMYDDEEVAFFNENDPAKAWYTLAYRDPTLQRHSISATGGSDKVKYFLGGSYFDQTAFIKNADFKKYNFRSNIDVNFTKNLTGTFNVAYNQGTKKRFAMQEDLVGFDVNPQFGNLWGRLLYYLPNVPPKTSDGKFINPGWIGNPLAFVEEGGTNTRVERNVALLLGLTYKVPFVEGLSVSGKYSPNYVATTMKLHELKTTLYDVVREGTNGAIYTDEVIGTIKSAYPNKERLAKIQEATDNYQLNFAADYTKQFGRHNIDAVFIYEQSEGAYDYFYGVRENFPLVQNDQFWATSASRNDSYVSGTEREFGRASYIGRIVYNYDEKYFVNATARRDGSMLFGPDYRWGTFPSVSAGWVISKETFFKAKDIDFLKLRGSWGLAGNDAVGGWKWSESYGVSGDYLLGTAPQPRVTYNGIVNEKLTWEKTRELNLGIDARLFNRFLFTAEYFNRHNYDILDTRIASLPVSFGGSMPPENYGIVDAHGYELELGYIGSAGQVEYGIKGNFSYAANKVKLRDVAQNVQDVDNPNGRPTDYIRMLVATDIIRTQKDIDDLPSAYTIYGRAPELGALNFEDVNGQDGIPDGKIDDYDRQVLKGKHALNPYTFGLNLNAGWKGLRIDVFFQGVTGGSKLYDDGYGRRFFDGARPPTFWLDSWSPDNIDARYPRPVTWDYTMDHLPSTFWLKNGSFLRLQYVNLSYALPKSLCQKITVSGISFFVSGTNLLTFSKYDYHDPNVGSMNAYPTMKTFTFGANVLF
ncbi:TonB-dependent receptor [Agriterribacter sp.]|uniref:SusC/RagA family TonB-linked outer membrane protein n=1 Tax=Agriterribacter sp. TaxID=2821509 RepID=UPI002C0D316F|nr:TonB-dependent receptor [Agriterribacter sp.]HRO44774.1 TonB-dependent receptor [Agriterribacter sp.]